MGTFPGAVSGEVHPVGALKDRQQSIRAILVWSQYIGDWYVPPKILYTYYISLRS